MAMSKTNVFNNMGRGLVGVLLSLSEALGELAKESVGLYGGI